MFLKLNETATAQMTRYAKDTGYLFIYLLFIVDKRPVRSKCGPGIVGYICTDADTIRYDTRCYFNVRSKADISQLNLPHGTDN